MDSITWKLLFFVISLQVLGCLAQKKDDTLIIRSILLEPFLNIREGADSSLGNEQYEGYYKELFDRILLRRGQDYIIQADGENMTTVGEKDENGTWSGMLGELDRQEVDIVAAPMLLTSEMRRTGFMTRGLREASVKAVMRPPSQHTESRLFIFLRPFKPWAWVVIFVAFFVVGLVLWVIRRSDPYDDEYWGARVARNVRKTKAEGARDGFWVAFSGLMWQGYEDGPRSTGGRILLGVWFVFILAVGSFYIANMVHVLEQRAAHVTTAPRDIFTDDAINSGKYVYTVVEGDGGHIELFRTSHISRFQTLAEKLETVPTVEEGLQRAGEEDNVVFISDDPILDYNMQREPCGRLASVHGLGLIPRSQYGLAVSKKNPQLLNLINDRLEEAENNGLLNTLYYSWWKQDVQCEVESQSSDSGVKAFQPVTSYELTGPIIILLLGLLLAIIVTVIERVTYKTCSKWTPEKEHDVQLRHDDAAVA